MATSRARITSIREIAPTTYELETAMVTPPSITYMAGQYVSVRIPGIEQTRAYSLASPAACTDGFTLLVRAIGAGSQFLATLRVGDVIDFEGPRGAFALKDRHDGDVVFAATGVGAAPLFPMMEELVGRDKSCAIRFFWGFMERADLFWFERLARLDAASNFQSSLVFTGHGDGFVTEPVIMTVHQLERPTYYLCGNGQMIRDVIDGLLSRGIDQRTQIRTDIF